MNALSSNYREVNGKPPGRFGTALVRDAAVCTLAPGIISGSARTVNAMGVETHPMGVETHRGASEVACTAAFISVSLVCIQERQDMLYEGRRQGDVICGSSVGLPRRLIRSVECHALLVQIR